MTKIEKSTKPIISNAGTLVALELLRNSGIDTLINHHLGQRGKQAGAYQYSDIFFALFASQLSGGSSIEDVQSIRGQWTNHPWFETCSPDVILRGIAELSTNDTKIVSKSGVNHTFNINDPLNKLLLKMLFHTGLLKADPKVLYMLDLDNTINECEKYDALKTYKCMTGYQPTVVTIGKLPVYIEGRNGNSPAKYKMKDTIERCNALLGEAGIKIRAFRSDCAAYQEDVIDYLEEQNWTFYIRAVASTDLKLHIKTLSPQSWTTHRYNELDVELAELEYCPFGGTKSYRTIVLRKKKKSSQLDAFSQDNYEYYSIITNDRAASTQEVFATYNARGSSEKVFDYLKNDFNWNNLPCSFLNQNTAFMILSAISYSLFEWLKIKAAKHIQGVETTGRLKHFIYNFVQVAAKWIRSGRQTILKIYSLKNYDLLLLKT